MSFDKEDEQKLIELSESLKQKHSIKNIKFYYEDLPEQYWYIEVTK